MKDFLASNDMCFEKFLEENGYALLYMADGGMYGNRIVTLTNGEEIYTCYAYQSSNGSFTASTNELKQISWADTKYANYLAYLESCLECVNKAIVREGDNVAKFSKLAAEFDYDCEYARYNRKDQLIRCCTNALLVRMEEREVLFYKIKKIKEGKS